jgi:hypothetical protein
MGPQQGVLSEQPASPTTRSTGSGGHDRVKTPGPSRSGRDISTPAQPADSVESTALSPILQSLRPVLLRRYSAPSAGADADAAPLRRLRWV